MIYFMCFFASCICLLVVKSRRVSIDGKNVSMRIGAIFAILFPCILAGLRAPEIGTDVKNYVVYTFERVGTYSLIDVIHKHYLDLFYELLGYLITRFTSDVHWLHFITALIILGGVYCFIVQFKDKVIFALSLMIFFCLYYNQSLNIVRQWLAIGCYLFAVRFMIEKKPLPYFAISIVAILFHTSAVITIPIYFLYWFLMSPKDRQLKACLIVGMAMAGAVLFGDLLKIAISIGVLPGKYARYLNPTEGQSSAIMQLISRLPVFFLGTLFYRQMRKYDNRSPVMYVFLILDLILSMMSQRIGYASRLSIYFGVWKIAYISELCFVIRKALSAKEEKNFVVIVFVGVLLLYWYYCYIYRGFSGTFPYASDIML